MWWSVFTVLTGLARNYYVLIIVRFLFGAGEAGAYPNITRALHNWFPMRQWEFAQGTVWMSGRLMGGLTPLVWALLVAEGSLLSWRGAFLAFGAIGLVWCAAFLVCLTRVYVGAHLPLDVVGGAAMGVVLGILANTVANAAGLHFRQRS